MIKNIPTVNGFIFFHALNRQKKEQEKVFVFSSITLNPELFVLHSPPHLHRNTFFYGLHIQEKQKSTKVVKRTSSRREKDGNRRYRSFWNTANNKENNRLQLCVSECLQDIYIYVLYTYECNFIILKRILTTPAQL